MSTVTRRVLLSLAGAALAVLLAFVSYHLLNEPVGLSREPTTAGDLLAPSLATDTTGSTGVTGTTSHDQEGPQKKTGPFGPGLKIAVRDLLKDVPQAGI
ncbi:MAG: hypothetical protein HZB14_01210 [Actinobacteria bacterium]|nr:hypothetical protein [Actinomycetota bacterium]